MNLQTILGKKMEQSQKFLEDGTRIPVTRIWVKGNVVAGVRTAEKNHYSAIQLGFGTKRKANKAEMGNAKGAKLEKAPKFLKEVRMNEDTDIEAGASINAVEILKEGDIIDVTATSKGKGYAGVVKRHGFRGGPRTHGQSDRERAPGSIGQTTTPGRVYKGKRMAGRMGHETVTIRNLQVVGVTDDEILIKGLVPGSVNTIVIVKKVGESKKYTPLFGIKTEEVQDVEEVSEIKQEEVEAAEQSAHAEGDVRQKEDQILETGDGQAQVSSDVQPDKTKAASDDQASLSGNQSTQAEGSTEDNPDLVSDSLETDSSVSSEGNKEEVKEEKIEEVKPSDAKAKEDK